VTPAKIGHYPVVRQLGSGGMATVYLVRDVAAGGREVALKLQRDDGGQPKALERFLREAELLAGLSHPGVVRIHATGRLPEGPYLLMDHVEGVTLGDLSEPCEPREAARLTREVADAVSALHARSLLHRDLKPSNVILRADGRPVLLDFGLARSLREDALTRTGEVLGTPSYMAPEQADGATPASLGPTVDVYGLGALLFELLTGRAPYLGSPVTILMDILAGPPPAPSSMRRGVPSALDAIVRKATAPKPADRYPDAGSLRDDLDRFLAGEVPLAQSRLVRGKAPRLVAGLLLAVGVAGAAAWAWPGSSGPAPAAAHSAPRLSAVKTEVSRGRATVRGRVETTAPWAVVRLGGAEERLTESGPFSLSVAVSPVTTQLSLEVEGPGGAGQPRRVSTGAAWPRWFARMEATERPPLPLPGGLFPATERGTYGWERDGSLLVWVPGGTFSMGQTDDALVDPSGWSRDKDQAGATRVQVTLTRGVFVGREEVSWAQWGAYCAATGRQPPSRVFATLHRRSDSTGNMEQTPVDDPWTAKDEHPVVGFSYADVQGYLEWAGLRLPTEAEWERAARGERSQRYVWGDEFDEAAASGAGRDRWPFTSPGGNFPRDASPYGCLDMAGNVSEFVSDEYAPRPAGPLTDPTGPARGEGRVLRGSNHTYSIPVLFEIAYRAKAYDDGHASPAWGFRVALSPAER
jgi:formylglycine-generating enzyme required for sulfatase activity